MRKELFHLGIIFSLASELWLSKVTQFGVLFCALAFRPFQSPSLKSSLSLKSKIPKTLMSRVEYHIKCPGCNSRYVVQTTRHLATRLHEHSRKSSHVGSHLLKCGQIMKNASVRLLDRSNRPIKLLTLEALHLSRLQPGIIQKEEYRSRELTLRV